MHIYANIMKICNEKDVLLTMLQKHETQKKRVSCEKNCININIYHDDEHTFIDYLYAKLIHYTVILFEHKIYII